MAQHTDETDETAARLGVMRAELVALELADDETDRLASLLELAEIDNDQAEAELRLAGEEARRTAAALDSAFNDHRAALRHAVDMRRRLGLMRTADRTYITVREARAQHAGAAAAAANAGHPIADALPKHAPVMSVLTTAEEYNAAMNQHPNRCPATGRSATACDSPDHRNCGPVRPVTGADILRAAGLDDFDPAADE